MDVDPLSCPYCQKRNLTTQDNLNRHIAAFHVSLSPFEFVDGVLKMKPGLAVRGKLDDSDLGI